MKLHKGELASCIFCISVLLAYAISKNGSILFWWILSPVFIADFHDIIKCDNSDIEDSTKRYEAERQLRDYIRKGDSEL